ncbi:hypothetical protein PF005_g17070 [Phytophthora fragariae]|uniref:Uncharacterized protein n=2 Tax=Phytophthora fragariae TaxID=53985 RepID=A0A6A3X4T0_9STRA|nr:hypothetical protein PF003_g4633 [Phytophthora fragariae]KAE8931689.1 hypothetical protein PF009_g18261 [Phytophthora fragariae]KAE9195963.1 hypothetical protein PF005_g17070 [Phytophthora fragariae]KAE9212157.1 hypothetical protein PF002_g18328 [Phytophthora fragariae]KAE9297500.1 hypothetical protein PF001_g16379 [Phytophthora fragariae]
MHKPTTTERASTGRWRTTLQRRIPPPRHALTDDSADNPDADMADRRIPRDTQQPTTAHITLTRIWRRGESPETRSNRRRRREPRRRDSEQDPSYDVIADEGEADAAREDGVEMSDDAEEMRDESSLEKGASVEAEDEEGTQVGRRTLVITRQPLLPRFLSRIMSRIPIKSETVSQQVE